MTSNQSAWVELSSDELRVQIDPLGAQLSTLQDRTGHDLLWNGDAAIWSGRAPWLFPIVGALAGGRYRFDGKSYALPRHGFARGKPFEVIEADGRQAVFRLRADPGTLTVYPFQFELDVRFELLSSTLKLTAQIRNLGPAAMPASFGFHPAFRWPLPTAGARASHFIEFAVEESAPVRRLNAEGLVTPNRYPTPIRGRRLPLDDRLFMDDALILDAVRSRSVRYGTEVGPQIQVEFPRTPFLGLWSKPGAPFICIEPWHGVADPEGFNGALTEKPGIFSVGPGAVTEVQVQIGLTTR